MRDQLQTEIKGLKKSILAIGVKVEEAFETAVKSLVDDDVKAAQKIVDSDVEIDQMEVTLEEECLEILALHQPVARDLRYVIAVLKINNDLERIGDLAVNMAERELIINKFKGVEIPDIFATISKKVKDMLRRSINALINADAEAAIGVCAQDDEIDDLYKKAVEITEENINNRTEFSKCYISHLYIFRSLERIADHVTNIAEDVVYMVEGEIARHRRENVFSKTK